MNREPVLHAAGWRGAAPAARAEYAAWRAPRSVPGALDMWQVVSWLDAQLPDDAILANGAGNFATWLHRIFRYRGFRTQLAPYSGSMGYGVPAAVAAKLVHPGRVVVSWNGDGCFLMNGQELATAVQYGLAIVFVVVDNGMYGTIRMHQERTYPARVSGTDLVNPDFAALARAYGAHGETVARTDDFATGVRARSGERQAGAAARQARSAGAHAQCVPRRAARAGNGRAGTPGVEALTVTPRTAPCERCPPIHSPLPHRLP